MRFVASDGQNWTGWGWKRTGFRNFSLNFSLTYSITPCVLSYLHWISFSSKLQFEKTSDVLTSVCMSVCVYYGVAAIRGVRQQAQVVERNSRPLLSPSNMVNILQLFLLWAPLISQQTGGWTQAGAGGWGADGETSGTEGERERDTQTERVALSMKNKMLRRDTVEVRKWAVVGQRWWLLFNLYMMCLQKMLS